MDFRLAYLALSWQAKPLSGLTDTEQGMSSGRQLWRSIGFDNTVLVMVKSERESFIEN